MVQGKLPADRLRRCDRSRLVAADWLCSEHEGYGSNDPETEYPKRLVVAVTDNGNLPCEDWPAKASSQGENLHMASQDTGVKKPFYWPTAVVLSTGPGYIYQSLSEAECTPLT